MIAVVLAILNTGAKKHIQELLTTCAPAIELNTSTVLSLPIDIGCEPREVADWLQTYFLEGDARTVVLISDLLVQPLGRPAASPFAAECLSKIGQHAFGSLGIMERPQRVPDIDRTIRPDAAPTDFQRNLTLVIDRVQYMAAPIRSIKVEAGSISVRPFRTANETEFRKYFGLRHRVYTIMGYLEEEIEISRSKLEMNEADVHALHLGAFHRSEARETLVGAVRVVVNGEANRALQEMFERLAHDEPSLRERLNRPYPLGLPIFQSHGGMNQIMREIFILNQSCGELSRVIVDREFRGNGISHLLITDALRRSAVRGVQRLFLECLKGHQQLYEKHGFRCISGIEGPVVDVYRTMIAMERHADERARINAILGRKAATS